MMGLGKEKTSGFKYGTSFIHFRYLCFQFLGSKIEKNGSRSWMVAIIMPTYLLLHPIPIHRPPARPAIRVASQ